MSRIEKYDRKRMKHLSWYLSGYALFLILWLIRFFSRVSGLNETLVGDIILAGLLVSAGLMALSTAASHRLGRAVREDPGLQRALSNEFVRQLEKESWKAAYFAAAAAAVFFAISSWIYPVIDPVVTALTVILAGAGAQQAAFYFRYRAA